MEVKENMNISSNSKIQIRLVWFTAFAIAMGFLETSVVVYMRELLYPHGFAFPLAPINNKLATIEILREAATLIMLVAVGMIMGRTRTEKFALFLYGFGIWDIFYYIFLKLLINWPDSLQTWDILFLIPVTWTSPVLAPLISSLSMVILSLCVIYLTNLSFTIFMSRLEWILLSIGACFQFTAFIWDYSHFILSHYSLGKIWSIQSRDVLYSLSIQYIPESFNWGIFLVGEFLLLISIYLFCWRNFRKSV
jgi:hypothetical protein